MTTTQPSGTVTLVFTDIEGSTRLLEELGTEGYRLALAEHRKVVRAACSRYDGYEVDYEGDAFFYAFATAQTAVAAVAEAMSGLDDGPVRVRVGIHSGEPVLDPPGYMGLDVHRAERIMSAAHGGQVVLSRETARLLAGWRALRDLGDYRLEGLAAPERLYQLGGREFPRLRSLPDVTLPVPGTPFLGRADELMEVARRLADPDACVLTLVGPGGTGKTRLALQAASRAVDRYPDGVTWVALAPLHDPALVVPTIAQALEVREESGKSLTESVAESLLGRRALLLLDNAEHLLPAVGDAVARLAEACPTMRLLVTSRERLGVAGESVWPVPALAERDGEELFVARARSHGVTVEVDEMVAALCRRLDRLPLAIELAAARTPELSPAQILERLDDRLGLLATRARDVDDRQRTLEATIAWSYELLDAEEQRTLRALSVFAGACTFEAAVHVASTSFELLDSLLDKNLLRHHTDSAGLTRYTMLETIGQYASERLDEIPGDRALARAAHIEWFYAFAEPSSGYPWTASPERVAELEQGLDDLRVVHEELVERSDVLRALRMAVNLFPLWEMRDRFAEGDRWLERALTLPGDELTSERGVALDARSSTADRLIRPDDSRRYAAQAVEILRVAGTPAQLAMALQGQAGSLDGNDPARAVELGEAALELAQASGDPWTLRTALLNLGASVSDNGDRDRAASLVKEALARSRELGDENFVAASLEGLADIQLDRHRAADAWRLYLEAAELASGRHGRLTLGMTVAGLAASAALLGEDRLARRLWASVERWEGERGAPIQAVRRSRYQAAIDDLGAGETPAAPSTLDEAVELARAFAPRSGVV